MSSFDWEIVQGDTAPIYTDTLTYSDGSPADLTGGATVVFVMRSLLSASPLTLTGAVTITEPATGDVQFAPSAADTAAAGDYMAQWHATLANGATMTWPTTGYISVRIHENLATAGGQQLVSLPDVKDYLSIPANDRVNDAKLVRFISAVRPVVEQITGPIIQTDYDEWHDGGSYLIQLRRRPRTGYGTDPVLTISSVTEYRGPISYELAQVATPADGTLYSYMVDRLGTLTRRTTGGGAIPFMPGENTVHVQYTAGQSSVPWNVYEGTLELLRVNYQTTQAVGRGRFAQTDDLDTGPPLGFYVPRRVREMLAPTGGRAPSVG